MARRAEKTSAPVIGFLHAGSREETAQRLAAFLKGLKEEGFVEGENVDIEYRWADGQADQLESLASDLVRRQVAVIATPAATAAAVAAKKATAAIPIVFAVGSDPVALGLVASLSRPGGNATGVTSIERESRRQAARHDARVGAAGDALRHPDKPDLADERNVLDNLQAGAASLGVRVDVLRASSESEIDAAFASLPQEAGGVFISSPDAFFYSRREKIVALVQRHALPSLFDVPEYVEVGALASYGNDFIDAIRMSGGYVGRILKGEKPADLPVIQAEKFVFAINLKTAAALGLEIPATLLAAAEEVIE